MSVIASCAVRGCSGVAPGIASSGNTRASSAGSMHHCPLSSRVADSRPALIARRIVLLAVPVACDAVPRVKLAMVRAVPMRVARHGAAERLTIRRRKAGACFQFSARSRCDDKEAHRSPIACPSSSPGEAVRPVPTAVARRFGRTPGPVRRRCAVQKQRVALAERRSEYLRQRPYGIICH